MQRKEFLQHTAAGCCACAAFFPEAVHAGQDDPEKTFLQHWVTDLVNTLDAEFSEADKARLMAGCGRGCYDRHAFKQEIAAAGKGDVDRLVQAYERNFEAWREGERVHIRYGETSKGCYCPAARFRAAKPNDLHCYCTAATHQKVFETALARPVKVEILETVRRGGRTCHFLVDTSAG